MKFKNIKFKGETWSYIAPSWDKMGEINFRLAKTILETGKKFDILVTLAKGGWTWSRSMADMLDIPDITSFQLVVYDPLLPGKKLEKITLKRDLDTDIKNKRVFLFDDVNDSGDSLEFSLKYLRGFLPKSITSATLFHKPHSKIKPDYYGLETSAWIIFPHERRESIVGLAKKWLNSGLKQIQIKNRLLKIGLPEKEIDLFLRLENTV